MTTVQRCPYRTCAAIVCHGSTIHKSTHENGGAMASAQSKSHVLALTSGKANTPWTLAHPDAICKSCTHDRVMYEPWAPTDQPRSRDSGEKDHWSFGTLWRYQYTLQHLQSASHIKQTIYKRTPYHEPMATYWWTHRLHVMSLHFWIDRSGPRCRTL